MSSPLQVATHYLLQHTQQPSQGGPSDNGKDALTMSLWADLIELARTAPAEMSEADLAEQFSLCRSALTASFTPFSQAAAAQASMHFPLLQCTISYLSANQELVKA